MQFYSAPMLLLLLLLPVLAFVIKRKKLYARIKFSSVDKFAACPVSWRIRLRSLLLVIRFACLLLLIFALARPRKGTVISQKSTEGVAIQVVLDRSGSMAEQMDYFGKGLNRLEVAKRVLTDFIRGDDKDLKGHILSILQLRLYLLSERFLYDCGKNPSRINWYSASCIQLPRNPVSVSIAPEMPSQA